MKCNSQFCNKPVNAKAILRPQTTPTYLASWHIHSLLHAFTQLCTTYNPNKNITNGDIYTKISPVVTFTHAMHFTILQWTSQCKNDTQTTLTYLASWHMHSHLHAFTQLCSTYNPNINIINGDIYMKISPIVTFTHAMHFTILQWTSQCENDTQTTLTYLARWHMHSQLHAFILARHYHTILI